MLKVLDLFSGLGGFTIGLERTGRFETVGFVEIEPWPQKVLANRWPNVPIYDDITKLDYNKFKGIDVLTGGFPCQDISIASSTKAGIDGKRSGLWKEYHKAISAIRPAFAIVENVENLRTRGLDRVLTDLAKIGYDAAWTLFDSQYFGVPQRRRRFYILAVRDGIPEDTDIFEFADRIVVPAARKITDDREREASDIAAGKGERDALAFFARVRSNQFLVRGVSSTLAKRDYKSYTDLILHPDGTLRRVMPRERLRLQGLPDDLFDGLEIPLAEQFRMNGMTANVVEHIGNRIIETFCI